jgi:hypothetical protein
MWDKIVTLTPNEKELDVKIDKTLLFDKAEIKELVEAPEIKDLAEYYVSVRIPGYEVDSLETAAFREDPRLCARFLHVLRETEGFKVGVSPDFMLLDIRDSHLLSRTPVKSIKIHLEDFSAVA